MERPTHIFGTRHLLFIALCLWSAMVYATQLSLFAPTYGSCGEVSINGAVLPSSGDTIAQPPVWNWGDGTITSSFFPATHEYSQPGNFVVQVAATSQAGQSVFASAPISITAIDSLCSHDLRIKPGTIVLRGGTTSSKISVSLRGPAGEYVALDNSQVQFTSSNPALVQVDAAGTVRSTGFGEATITAKPTRFPRSATAKVIAGHARIEPPLLVLSMTGQKTARLTIDAAAADGTPIAPSAMTVVWQGGNGIASVDATGWVTALRTPAVFTDTPYISAQVNGLNAHNRSVIRVLPDTPAITFTRMSVATAPRTVFDIVDNLQGFSQRQMFNDYDVPRVNDLAHAIMTEVSGVTPNSGDTQYLVNDVAHDEATRPCGLSSNPVRLGSHLDSGDSCLTGPPTVPAWGIFSHEMGHNFTSGGSLRFAAFARIDNVQPSGIYTEGLASLMAMYSGRVLRDRSAQYGLSQKVVDSIMSSHLTWWHPGSTPSLDNYISSGAKYGAMTPDILDDMLMVLMEENGYAFVSRFLSCFLPADTAFPFPIESQSQQVTFFVAALSAATKMDLRSRFRGAWGFPVDDAYYGLVYPSLVQWASHADAPIVPSPVQTMVEYRYVPLDYYFITSRDSDKSILDTAPGWSRTGKSFSVLANNAAGSSPITRFYFDQVARGKSRGSHFYTLLPDEVAAVQALNPTNQPAAGKPVSEGIDSYAYLPSTVGTCASGQVPVYRLFRGNVRFPDDPNHRFTSELSIYNSFVSLGWDGEGVKFCAPQ